MNHESYLDFWVFVIWVASCVLGYHWEHLAFESGMVTVCFSTSNYVILCVMIWYPWSLKLKMGPRARAKPICFEAFFTRVRARGPILEGVCSNIWESNHHVRRCRHDSPDYCLTWHLWSDMIFCVTMMCDVTESCDMWIKEPAMAAHSAVTGCTS